jgi:hypothetical protein
LVCICAVIRYKKSCMNSTNLGSSAWIRSDNSWKSISASKSPNETYESTWPPQTVNYSIVGESVDWIRYRMLW